VPELAAPLGIEEVVCEHGRIRFAETEATDPLDRLASLSRRGEAPS
jgi:hypothetical protein